jgi:putative hydrolase of the HAD superfamily
MSTPRCVLLDLGNTLVSYYGLADIPVVLRECLSSVRDCLAERGHSGLSAARLFELFEPHSHESEDHRVRPLWERLSRALATDGHTIDEAYRGDVELAFLRPIFARSKIYEDTLPVLRELHDASCVTAVVSNTPWGAPGRLWRSEIARHGIEPLIDHEVFCTDVGWRKPARQIFDEALRRCGTQAREAVFVGDDPRWDIEGAKRAGIPAILLDRSGCLTGVHSPSVKSLREALAWMTGSQDGRLLR